MDTLTLEKRAQLTALIDELNTFPTYVKIVRCEEAIGLDPTVEADRDRMDTALAGAWALNRLLLYLNRLRSLNEERMQLGVAIRELKRDPFPTTAEEVETAARASVLAPHFAGELEVVVNFFCVSVQHIRSLLKVVAEAIGYEICKDDLDYLDEFRVLRNHFEHWYSRLPGKVGEAGLVTKSVTADGYHVWGGLQSDAKDRAIVIEPKKSGPVTHVVDVTNSGVARIEKIVQETTAQVGKQSVERVRAHFIAHLEKDIPLPESIDQDFLIDVGGFEP